MGAPDLFQYNMRTFWRRRIVVAKNINSNRVRRTYIIFSLELLKSVQKTNFDTARIQKESNLDMASVLSLQQNFEVLTRETIDQYLARMYPSFGRAGVKNLWHSFLTDIKYENIANLYNDAEEFYRGNRLTYSEPVRLSIDKKFLLYDGVFEGRDFRKLLNESNVSIATQTSLQRIDSFVESFRNWIGPISLSIFLQGTGEYFLLKCK